MRPSAFLFIIYCDVINEITFLAHVLIPVFSMPAPVAVVSKNYEEVGSLEIPESQLSRNTLSGKLLPTTDSFLCFRSLQHTYVSY